MNKLISLLLFLSTGCIGLAQNVGIGTLSPADKLHVFGNTTVENSTYPWLSFRNNGSLKGYIGVQNNNLRIGTWPGTNTTGHIALVTNDNDRMRIMSDGDVGIATLSPRGIFDVGGADQPVYFASSTITGNQRIAYMPGDIMMAPWAGTNISYLEARRSDNSGSTNLQMRTSNNGILQDVFFISTNAKVGINTSNPGATLEVLQRANRGFLLQNPNGEHWEQTVTFDNNGFPPPTLQYYFNGTLRAQLSNTTGTWSSVSDARLKSNITSLPPVLDKLLQLDPCMYYMANDSLKSEKSIGFIAQKVKKIFPELVSAATATMSGSNTELNLLNYDGFGVLAIKAIQEQQEKIQGQQEQIETLKNELAELKKQFALLAKRSIEIKN